MNTAINTEKEFNVIERLLNAAALSAAAASCYLAIAVLGLGQ